MATVQYAEGRSIDIDVDRREQLGAIKRLLHILDRELAPLEAIRDHNPKYLLTMDFTPVASHNGIKQINALDWLLSE